MRLPKSQTLVMVVFTALLFGGLAIYILMKEPVDPTLQQNEPIPDLQVEIWDIFVSVPLDATKEERDKKVQGRVDTFMREWPNFEYLSHEAEGTDYVRIKVKVRKQR